MSETNDDIKDGEFAAGRMAFLCTGVGPELYTLPPGAQVCPNTYDELWKIVEVLAREDPAHEVCSWYKCQYCNATQDRWMLTNEEGTRIFPHEPSCIVTKARALVEPRKAQPQITVTSKETK